MDNLDLSPTSLPPTENGSMSRQARRARQRMMMKVRRYARTKFDWSKIKRQPYPIVERTGSRHNGGYTADELHQRAMDRLNMAKYHRLSPLARALFQPVTLREWVK